MRPAWILFGLMMGLPSVGAAQSILGTAGLGIRTESLDAVQRAMGGVGPAAGTATVLPGEPTASLDLLAPTLTFTVQPSWGNYTLGPEEGDFRGTRFPILGFAYPLGIKSVLTLTAGSVFDQRWTAVTEGTIDVSGESIPITDTFRSDGGVSALRVGFARRLSTTFALGASAGLYRGQVSRTFNRSFNRELDSLVVVTQIAPFNDAGRWTYSGPVASLNASWDPIAVVQLGASLGWSGTISGEPVGITQGEIVDVAVPVEIRVAATTILSPSMSVSLGFSTANWTNLGNPEIDALAVGRIKTFGAGLQLQAGSVWAGPMPLRFGYRHTELPFLFRGERAAENTISGGLTIVMAQALGIPLAAMDAALEIGSRSAGDLDEKFRRLTITIRVGGR